MDAGGDAPPFQWQPPTTVLYRRRRHRRPTPLFDSSLAIVLLPCLALLLLFLLIHSFKSPQPLLPLPQQFYIPQIYQNQIPNLPVQVPVLPQQKPPAHFFRRSWDSLNVVLIIAAILCGVFARRNEDAPPPPPPPPPRVLMKRNQFSFPDFPHQHHQHQHHQHPYQVQHQQWCQYGDNRRMYGCSPRRSFGGGVPAEIRGVGGGGNGLRRASSAHPEFMRNEASLWEEETRRLRFFDDHEINRFYSPPENDYPPNHEQQAADTSAVDSVEDSATVEISEIPIDDFVASAEIEEAEEEEEVVVEIPVEDSAPPSSRPPPPMSPAPPPPPPPPVSRSKPKRSYQSVPRKEKAEKSAPPPGPEPLQQPEKKLRRKKSNTTKEIAMVLASLYTSGKRKRKHRNKTEDQDPPIPDEITAPERQHRFPPPSPPPPPPPLPPPPSVFSNFFKKSTKHKKIHSVSSAPPPPPPQPSAPISDPPLRRRSNSSSRKPPLPVRPSNTGSQSPLVQIPSPPPPPPPKMRYAAVRSDAFLVQTWSTESSRAGSPEPRGEVDLTTTSGDVEESRGSDVGSEINGGGNTSMGPAVSCPSPDVNTKADSFIARHHNGWRLEKLNSWREKRV